MRWTNKRIVSEFGERDNATGEIRMLCPTCEDKPQFDTIEQWKEHMQREHGGYTSTEIESGQIRPDGSTADEPTASAAQPAAQPVKPKRLTQHARELNIKVNRCISLVVKHIVSGITDTERIEMEDLRTSVTEAFMGIEFDFDERLFSLNGKWAILAVLVALYLLPNIPSMKETLKKAMEKKAASALVN